MFKMLRTRYGCLHSICCWRIRMHCLFSVMGYDSMSSISCRLFGLGIGCHCCECHFGFNVVDGLRAGSHYHLCDFTLGIV
jgi:hypothetical protein